MKYLSFLNLLLKSETDSSSWIASHCLPWSKYIVDGWGLYSSGPALKSISHHSVLLQPMRLKNVTRNEALAFPLISQIMHVNITSLQLYFLIKKVSYLEKVLSDSVCQAVCLLISLDALLHKTVLIEVNWDVIKLTADGKDPMGGNTVRILNVHTFELSLGKATIFQNMLCLKHRLCMPLFLPV